MQEQDEPTTDILTRFPELHEWLRESQEHPLLTSHADISQREGLLQCVEKSLQAIRECPGYQGWMKRVFMTVGARNIRPVLSEASVAAFLREHVDELEFHDKSFHPGDKPPDFVIKVGGRTAFVETEMLTNISRISQQLDNLLQQANRKLYEKGLTWWLEHDWYRPNLTAQRQADVHLLAREFEELETNLAALLSQPASAIKVGQFFHGKHLRVWISTLNEQPETPPRLPEPLPFAFRVLKYHLQDSVLRKAGKKSTTSRTPYLLAFDVTTLGVAQVPDAWSMLHEHGNLTFELPADIDGVLILQECTADGCLQSRGSIRPIAGHSSYWLDAVAILDQLAPVYTPVISSSQ